MWRTTCTAVFLWLCAFGVCVDFAWGVSVVSWGIIATKQNGYTLSGNARVRVVNSGQEWDIFDGQNVFWSLGASVSTAKR